MDGEDNEEDLVEAIVDTEWVDVGIVLLNVELCTSRSTLLFRGRRSKIRGSAARASQHGAISTVAMKKTAQHCLMNMAKLPVGTLMGIWIFVKDIPDTSFGTSPPEMPKVAWCNHGDSIWHCWQWLWRCLGSW